MGERLRIAMTEKEKTSREAFGESDLVDECNRLAGRRKGDPEFVKQQLINQILNGDVDGSRSSFVSLLAEAVGVRCVWLQYGFGQMKDDRALADSVLELVKQHKNR